MKIRTAVILCGGKGTRLGLIGKKTAKTMVKVQNFPIIWYIIKVLQKNKFNHFILPVGYRGEQIKAYFKNKKLFPNSKIDIIDTGQNSTIAQRIFKVKKKILSKSFLLLNGDAIFNFNLKNFFETHESQRADATFLGCSVKLPYGVIAQKNNKIVDFIKDIEFNSVKKKNVKNFIGYVYSGISILKTKLLKRQFKNYKNFEILFYPPIIKSKKTKFEQIDGFWHSIDNYKDIDDVNNKENKIKYNQVKKIIKKFK